MDLKYLQRLNSFDIFFHLQRIKSLFQIHENQFFSYQHQGFFCKFLYVELLEMAKILNKRAPRVQMPTDGSCFLFEQLDYLIKKDFFIVLQRKKC